MADGSSRTPFELASAVRHKARLAGMNPNYWYPLEWSDRVAPGSAVETMFWGESIAVFRGEDGRARALESRCAHRQIKLTIGHVRGCDLVCLYHGWRYDEAGGLVEMKHDNFGKKLPVINIRSYPVGERYGLIWAYLGDPADAERVHLPFARTARPSRASRTRSWVSTSTRRCPSPTPRSGCSRS